MGFLPIALRPRDIQIVPMLASAYLVVVWRLAVGRVDAHEPHAEIGQGQT